MTTTPFRPAVSTRERPTLLLVEDDPLVRSITAEILRSTGFHVLEAGDGTEALMHVEKPEAKIDLLVADLLLPATTGPDVAEEVRRLRPGTKVIFITGHSEDVVDRARVAALGATILSKPYRIEDLTKRVRDALGMPSPGAP